MKKFYFILVFLGFSILVSAQDLGGTPVEGLIPITRISDATETPTDSISNANPVAPTAATAVQNYVPTPTGPSTEVGITEGQLSVSLTGGANYAIPIAVPPGINGVVPQVSLAYNSQGGNGMAGYGWNVSGVSAITRIPRTKFHDGVVGGVNLDANDRFALDGQRLILKSGVYGSSSAVYETESFSNLKIRTQSLAPSGIPNLPSYCFIVDYPDGSVALYGYTIDSRSKGKWGITYFDNPQKVRISYNYINTNNNLNIEYIRYGNTSTLAPINLIKFVYKARQRPEQYYVGGESFLTNTLLSEIQVSGNSVGFRNYVLGHKATTLGYERLERITEKSGDNTKTYNPTVFSYNDSSNTGLFEVNPANPQLSVSNINAQNAGTVVDDFDGDGKNDFILFAKTGPDAYNKYWIYNDIYGNGLNIGYQHPVGVFSDIFTTSFLKGDASNGYKMNPRQGWTIAKNNVNNYTFDVYALILVPATTGYKFLPALQYTKVISFPTQSVGTVQACTTTYVNKIFPKKILSGDFNSDGVTDVIAIDMELESKVYGSNPSFGLYCIPVTSKIPSKKVYFVDLKSDNTTSFLTYSGELLANLTSGSKVEVIDFNNDGKSDFMVLTEGKVTVYTLGTTNNLIVLTTYSDAGLKADKPCLLGDYNGDGRTDFAIPQEVGTYLWNFYLASGSSNGSGFIIDATSGPKYLNNYSRETYVNGWEYERQIDIIEYNYFANDLNGDGKTDIVRLYNETFERIDIYRNSYGKPKYERSDYTNRGNPIYSRITLNNNLYNTTYGIYFSEEYLSIAGIHTYPISLLSNHSQPNLKLEFSLLTNNTIYTFNCTKDNRLDTSLRTITTGNGVKESITYKPLINNGYDNYYYYNYDNLIVYTPVPDKSVYPNIDIAVSPGFQVVSMLEKQSTSVYKKQLFSYAGAVSNMEGLGFLGFRATMRTNWHDDTTPIISTITKTDVNLRGAVTESFTVLGFSNANKILAPTDSFISRNINTYNLVDGVFENPLQTNKVFKLKLTHSKQTNNLDNTSAETNTEFDSYNNPITSTALLKEDENIVQTTVSTIVYKPRPTDPPYLIGIPASKTETVTVGDEIMTSEELYTSNTTGLLTQIKKKGTDTPYITETNTYSTYGSITRKAITGTGISRTMSYVYDTSKRFVIKATDVKGLITNYSYNPNNGLLESETNHYGQTTSYLYDPWFKRTITTDYLGKTNTLAYSRQNEKTRITATGDDGSYSEELYDDLGRKTRAGIKDIQGLMSFKEYLYDIYDRNFSVSEPYTTTPSQWNTTYYDLYGRQTAVANFTGKTIGMEYNGLTTTTTDSSTGNTKTAVKNAMGNVILMTEAPIGGTISYSYYPNGNLKETNYNDSKITIIQDGWGRKTSLTDPSAGNYSYTYNDIGEMLIETTPNGTPNATTTYTYDARGNVTKKVILGNNTSNNTVYTFNATTRLLTKSVYTDVLDASKKITTLYTYDLQGRLVTTSETTGYGAVFTKTVSYDAWGRADIETSTASLAGKTSTTNTQNTYKNGFAYQIKDYPNTKTLWETSEVNARGQLTKAKLGNNIEINNLYDNGYLTNTKHDLLGNTIMELGTDFNPQTGNLNWRKNSIFPSTYYEEVEPYSYIPTENFGYDSQNRLISCPDAQGNPVNQTYEDDGRIKTNTLGIYNYGDGDKKYQNKSITLDPEDASYYANREGIFSDGMEGGKSWKEPNGNIATYDAVEKHYGKTSLKIDDSRVQSYEDSFKNYTDVWTTIDNTVATQYSFSAWVLSKGSSIPRLYLVTDNVNAIPNSVTTTIKNQWVRIEGTFLVTANVKRLSLLLENYGYGNVWFDDVMIRKTANTPLSNLQLPNDSYIDRKLVIDYNTFKSPVNISEAGVDKLSFTYNENNDRSMMFYGSLDANKTPRPLRKYYSADGSMEIKATFAPGNTTTPIAVEFVTYIGGDGYSAPVIVKSDGLTQSFLYLHRDYQGSIIAITDDARTVLEKRQFDAWGSLIQLEQNGFLSPLPLGGAGGGLILLLDRGYTGHEHLQSIGLINMNGRLYDPKLHRFLQPDNFVQDPTNTQNYNRYSYVLNNPLKYTDRSGEETIKGNCPCEQPPYHGPNFNGTLYDWLENEKGGDGWLGKNFSARNIDEAGTAVGKAFRDAGNWIGRGLSSIFGGGRASAPVTQVMSNVGQQASVFGANYVGTIATNNITFGVVQAPYAFTGTNFEGAERLGRYAGDITTMLQGAIEDIGAGFGEVLSLGFATVPAGAVAIHGTALAGGSAYAGLAEARGFADYFARDRSGSSGGRPKMGNNGTKNEEVTSLVKKYNLDKVNQRKLHDYITGKNYSRSDIEKIIRNREYLMK